jgi:hypothetical protein
MIMRLIAKILTASIFMCSSVAHAGLISGFENGLEGWDYIGDVSVQNSTIGLAPTQGHNLAFLTTIGGATDLAPYSGTNSPSSGVAREFLGIQTIPCGVGDICMVGFPADTSMPGGGTQSYAYAGESAAIKTQFSVKKAGYVSFDWDRIGHDGDNAYFTIWNDDLGSRINGWLYDWHTYTDGFVPVDVGLCSRTTSIAGGCDFYNTHTDWHTMSVWIDTPGTYTIGFGMNEILEGTAPTVLAIDNLRFNVPEPSSAALMGLAVAGLAFVRRRKT